MGEIPFIAVGTAVVIWLFRRYLPAESAKHFGTEYSIAQLSQRFARTRFRVGAGMILSFAVISLGGYCALLGLNRLLALLEGPYDLILPDEDWVWWVVPLAAATTLCKQATLAAWAAITGDKEEVALYNYWANGKQGINDIRALNVVAWVFVTPLSLATALAIPSHTLLRPNDILERGYGFGQSHIFRYADAKIMTLVVGNRDTDGRVLAGVVLNFADGRKWSSVHSMEYPPKVDRDLVSYLRGKTHLVPVNAAKE